MKKNHLFFVFALSLFITSCGENNSKKNIEQVDPTIVNIDATASGDEVKSKAAKFSFEESNFDFGSIGIR